MSLDSSQAVTALCPDCGRQTSFERARGPACECGADLPWISDFSEMFEALCSWDSRSEFDDGELPQAITESSPELRLAAYPQIRMGRKQAPGDSASSRVMLNDPTVEMTHAYLAWHGPTGRAWLVDAKSEAGTFVNRRRIRACRLHSGDLVQIGPFAWQFSIPRHHPGDAYLFPVKGIAGCRLQLRGVAVPNRLHPIDLDVAAGELVAIIGPSGGGKSTMIKEVLAANRSGTVFVDGHDVALHDEWFRSVIGYVSQDRTLMEDLTAEEAVRFSGLLRGKVVEQQRIDSLLNEADLRYKPRNNRCSQLSGGESKRVHVAAEFICQPRLLILDEPGSGLDRARERTLMRTLRALSHRGCTTLIVTHGLHQLEEVDRVLVISDKTVRFFGPPADLCAAYRVQRLDDVDFDDPRFLSQLPQDDARKPAPAVAKSDAPRKRREDGFFRQTRLLTCREFAMLASRWGKRVFVPVVVLPALFALALAVAGLRTELFLFLAVLSSIWMAASLSLLSIADEWTAVKHEHLLFLRPAAYVTAKILVLTPLSSLQTLAFIFFLRCLSSWSSQWDVEILLPEMWPLFLTSFAAVGVGLSISAVARGNRLLANFILPLVMLCQIVFSVYVTGEHGTDPVHSAYAELSMHGCRRTRNDSECPLRARHYELNNGHYVWQCDVEDHQSILSAADVARLDDGLPVQAAVVASYFTLSRYGDLLIRLSAQEHFSPWRHPWGLQAIIVLSTATLVFSAIAWAITKLQLTLRLF